MLAVAGGSLGFVAAGLARDPTEIGFDPGRLSWCLLVGGFVLAVGLVVASFTRRVGRLVVGVLGVLIIIVVNLDLGLLLRQHDILHPWSEQTLAGPGAGLLGFLACLCAVVGSRRHVATASRIARLGSWAAAVSITILIALPIPFLGRLVVLHANEYHTGYPDIGNPAPPATTLSGKIRWRFGLPNLESFTPPTVTKEGFAISVGTDVALVNRNGELRWRYSRSDVARAPVLAATDHGHRLIVSWSGVRSETVVLDAATGRRVVRWSAARAYDTILSGGDPAVVAHRDGDGNPVVLGVDWRGRQVWASAPRHCSASRATAVGAILVVERDQDCGADDAEIEALDRSTGRHLWSVKDLGQVVGTGLGTVLTLRADGDEGGELSAISANEGEAGAAGGQVAWRRHFPCRLEFITTRSDGLIMASCTYLVPRSAGATLISIDRAGGTTVLKRTTVEHANISSIVITQADQTVAVMGDDDGRSCHLAVRVLDGPFRRVDVGVDPVVCSYSVWAAVDGQVIFVDNFNHQLIALA